MHVSKLISLLAFHCTVGGGASWFSLLCFVDASRELVCCVLFIGDDGPVGEDSIITFLLFPSGSGGGLRIRL